jgi:hypothetical protein
MGLLLTFASACDADPCPGYAGSCIRLVVEGEGEIDALRLRARGAFSSEGETRSTGGALPLPIETRVELAGVAGSLSIEVVASLAAVERGRGEVAVSLRPGEHVRRTVGLFAGPPVDLAGVDEQATVDLASPLDLTGSDSASSPGPRYIFLTAATSTGALGDADKRCQDEADASPMVQLQGHTFRALIGYPGTVVQTRIGLPAGDLRPVRLPSAALVEVTSHIFDFELLHAIDEDSTGNTAITDYVWTSFSADDAGGAYTPSMINCSDWTNGTSSGSAIAGLSNRTVGWSNFANYRCDFLARLYCLQVD